MTDEPSEFDWKEIFSERGFDPDPIEAPAGRESGAKLEWFQTMTRFTQRGFLRVIAAFDEETLQVELQVALPGGDDSSYLDALKSRLKASSSSVVLVSEQRPWTLDLEVADASELRELIDSLETLSEHVRRAEEGDDIAGLTSEWVRSPDGRGETSDDDVSTTTDQTGADDEAPASEQDAGVPFETIGSDEPEDAVESTTGEPASPDDAAEEPAERTQSRSPRVGAFSLNVRDDQIVLRAEADTSNDEDGLSQMARRLRSKLEARFDLMTDETAIEVEDESITLTMFPSELGATYGMALGELCDDVARYLDRQRDLAAMGVSLDAISPQKKRPREDTTDTRRRDRESDDGERPTRREPTGDDEETGVVFGFGEEDIAAARQTDSALEAGDYTDPRVMRDDATTALVDVVLRHPGYSDRNMRQVLSILLDIDYYRAGKLIDQAPCSIAWGVGQERARELKRVIEDAGGRITLVEPDTLADAE